MKDIERIKFSFRNAISGIRTAFETQRNLRIHIAIGILVLTLGIIIQVSTEEFILLLIIILLVIISELFNTAFEFSVDLISPEYNQLAKKVKDIGAAAVLITTIFAVIVGIIIFAQKIILLFLKIL